VSAAAAKAVMQKSAQIATTAKARNPILFFIPFSLSFLSDICPGSRPENRRIRHFIPKTGRLPGKATLQPEYFIIRLWKMQPSFGENEQGAEKDFPRPVRYFSASSSRKPLLSGPW
jgi:hypothetical protein